MRFQCSKRGAEAFNLIELILVVGVLLILALMIIPALRKAKEHDQLGQCVNNVRQLDLGLYGWSQDNLHQYPMELSETNWGARESLLRGDLGPMFRGMSNQLPNPKVLICPQGERKAAVSWDLLSNENMSYFIGVDAARTNQAILLGDRKLRVNGTAVKPGLVVLTTNDTVDWVRGIHFGGGVVTFADGTILTFWSSDKLRNELQTRGLVNNRLAVP